MASPGTVEYNPSPFPDALPQRVSRTSFSPRTNATRRQDSPRGRGGVEVVVGLPVQVTCTGAHSLAESFPQIHRRPCNYLEKISTNCRYHRLPPAWLRAIRAGLHRMTARHICCAARDPPHPWKRIICAYNCGEAISLYFLHGRVAGFEWGCRCFDRPSADTGRT